jgi:hypothetical protein
MLLAGGFLGRELLSGGPGYTLLPEAQGLVFHKPGEQARYGLAIIATMLFFCAIVMLSRRPLSLAPRLTRALVVIAQCVGAAFVLVCIWAQHTFAYGPAYEFASRLYPDGFVQPYFTIPTLVVGLALAAGAAFVIKDARAWVRVGSLLRSSRPNVSTSASVLAVIMTALWMLAAVNLDSTIGNADIGTRVTVSGMLDEVFAVLDGRSPLVNFIPTYASLWPYVIAFVMSVFGTTFAVFSIAMCTVSGLSLLAIFDVLRRAGRSAVAALMLYLPFLATSLFAMHGGLVNRYGPSTLYSIFPFRYAGPYFLVWLFARHLSGAGPRHRWMVLAFASLVVVNNVEFGIPALFATFAAILLVDVRKHASDILRLLRDVLAALLVSYALISTLTLIRAGSLPKLNQLFFFPLLYAHADYALLPTPTLGLHIVIYLTDVGAIALATVRAVRGDGGRVLTALLMWSGVFSLGVGNYFMGRSHPEVLVSMFSAWAFTLMLLTLATAQQMRWDRRRGVTVAQFAVLAGAGVMACSLASTPLPWTQIGRLQRRTKSIYVASASLKQALRHYSGGKPAVILDIIGHRAAYESGVVDISPYLGVEAIVTVQQADEVARTLRADGGHLLALPLGETGLGLYDAFCSAGFRLVAIDESAGLALWDTGPHARPYHCVVRQTS